MKILYATISHYPRNPDLGSGTDYHFYSAFLRLGYEVKIVGPFNNKKFSFENHLGRFYKRFTKRKYLKHQLTQALYFSKKLNENEKKFKPDFVFSIFPSALAFYTGNSPCIFRTDTCLESLQEISEIYGNYGRIPFSIMRWMEKQAINKSKVILVVSKWTRDEIIKKHKIEESKVKLIPMASALPLDMTPVELQNEIKKSIHNPIQLLLVGRNYYGKGVDIAIDAVNILNEKGIPCKLTVCGCSGENNNFVEFVGPFSKSNSEELEKYIDLYKNADILIHPSRYDGAGIVPAEAAAFAVPTITNDVGGLSTTVTHNETGIVLPNSSPSEKYAETIIRLINEPEFYRKLSLGARKKFEDEQNWFVVGEIVDKIIKNS